MPRNLPLISDLPPEALARLRTLNPELTDELLAPEAPEQADTLQLLREQIRLEVAKEAAWSSLLTALTMKAPTPPAMPEYHRREGLRYYVLAAIILFILVKALGAA